MEANMSEREWLRVPSQIEIKTVYGLVYITCHGDEDDAVYVDAQSDARALVVYGKQYPLAFHLHRPAGSWQLRDVPWAVSGFVPRSYRPKIANEVIRAVGTFLDLHPELLIIAARARTSNDLGSLEHDIEKLEATLADKRTQAITLAERLAKLDRIAPAPTANLGAEEVACLANL
jgi:hypothetical protein